MTDTSSTPETAEAPSFDVNAELTVPDILGGGDAPSYHTVLQMWDEILKSADLDAQAKVTPMWANKVCSAYTQVRFEDMPDFNQTFFHKIELLVEILRLEIDSDEECLKHTTPAEDVEHNSIHYLNIIVNWQKMFLAWELDWDCTHPDAAIELAAISEVHRMFFGDVGLTGLLDQIGFSFTEDHQAYLTNELEELKKSWEG